MRTALLALFRFLGLVFGTALCILGSLCALCSVNIGLSVVVLISTAVVISTVLIINAVEDKTDYLRIGKLKLADNIDKLFFLYRAGTDDYNSTVGML